MLIVAEVQKKVMRASREKKIRHFYSLFKEGQSVLDVGVASESKPGLPARNYFLKGYRYGPETYTGLGVQNLSGMADSHPGKRFVQYPGGRFPFSDKTFDWAFSNAVIEHVGDDAAHLLFVNEMMRVANAVFFTSPNRFFPVESHTNALFLHWSDALFYRWCRSRNLPWANRSNLYLFSLHRLRDLLLRSHALSFSIYKNRLIGMTMTFTVTCTDRQGIERQNATRS